MSLKKIIVIIIILLGLITIVIACNKKELKNKEDTTISSKKYINNKFKEEMQEKLKEKEKYEKLGSAKEIKNSTLIVSIFTNDLTTSFNFLDEADSNTMLDCLDNLKIATSYLENEIKKYGYESKFIYDFKANSDLLYYATFNENMVIETGEKYNLQNIYIKENININKLKKKYNASNIVYIFYYNTPYQNKVKPRTLRYTNETHIENEIINMYIKFGNVYIAPPATYAHEILHTFGAHDLYVSSNKISNEYVNYLTSINSNDIMYTVANSKEITNAFTELDAYYVGLKSEASDQKKWDLALSEH